METLALTLGFFKVGDAITTLVALFYGSLNLDPHVGISEAEKEASSESHNIAENWFKSLKEKLLLFSIN